MKKLYRLFDLQDENNEEIITLEGARKWLAEFWQLNPSEDMTDEEHDTMIKEIMQSDVDELCNRLQGIDYFIEPIAKSTFVSELPPSIKKRFLEELENMLYQEHLILKDSEEYKQIENDFLNSRIHDVEEVIRLEDVEL